MTTILLPAALYLVIHLLGWSYPALFWGADQLHYYPLPVGVAFVCVVLTMLAIGAKGAWAFRLDQAIAIPLQRLEKRTFSTFWLKALLLLLFFLVSYAFRVRAHHLGDSSMWFHNLEFSLSEAQRATITAIHGLPVAGLEYIPAFESLDFILHLLAYRLGYSLWGWTGQETYEWVSCAAGVLYLVVLWKLAAHLSEDLLERLTYFLLLVTLGSLQLFFGYGESYTLVTLVMACYLLAAHHCLRGHSLVPPALWLLLASALHIVALFLIPSLVYLIWQRKGRPWASLLVRPRIYWPLLLTTGALGLYLYTAFYPARLPLWVPEEEGKYALFSVPHFAQLCNAVLLVSPFGLLWGLGLFRRQASNAFSYFLSWAVLGMGTMFVGHDAFLGGRDWDLLAFPGLFYTLWGSAVISSTPARAGYLRQLRLVVLPLMMLHTALWIGINATPARAVARLGNLQLYTNQALHYRLWALGYYHLRIREAPAVPHFRAALAALPADTENRDSLRKRYCQYLGYSLTATGEYQEAVELFTQAYSDNAPLQTAGEGSAAAKADTLFLTMGPDNIACYESWIYALIQLGTDSNQRGERDRANKLWERAVAISQAVLQYKPQADFYQLQGIALRLLGNYKGAVAAFQQSILTDSGQQHLFTGYTNLAEVLYLAGDAEEAENALGKALLVNPDEKPAIERLRKQYSPVP